jgi:hypothetical protein
MARDSEVFSYGSFLYGQGSFFMSFLAIGTSSFGKALFSSVANFFIGSLIWVG